MSDVELERPYPQDPATVWTALTDRRALSAWLMPTGDFTPEVGASFSFRTRPSPGFDGVVRGEVLEVDAPRRLVFSWLGGGVDTVVTFRLTPTDDGGTRLRLTHTGFEGPRGAIVGRILRRGWRRLLDTRLRAAVALLADADPATLDVETVAAAAGDRQDDLDVRRLLRRWTDS